MQRCRPSAVKVNAKVVLDGSELVWVSDPSATIDHRELLHEASL
ncbi:hypothetical protein ACRU43_16955 [Mycobacterium colombiense]